jgi:hypothetical protein
MATGDTEPFSQNAWNASALPRRGRSMRFSGARAFLGVIDSAALGRVASDLPRSALNGLLSP